MDIETHIGRCATSRPRVALYAHDTMGLGHTRRNLLIAEALAASPLGADVLLISGARHASHYDLANGVDCVTLPALSKGADGSYAPRTLRLGLDEIGRLRSAMIDAALQSFRPDVFVVDNVPRGALDELAPVLARLRRLGGPRCVLGLRDVLDDPATVAAEWRDRDTVRTIETSFDEVWVYGDPTVYDVARECGFPPTVRGKLHHLGYLDPRSRAHAPGAAVARHAGERLVVCTVGGGQDGGRLAEAFATATAPRGTRRVLIGGPDIPSAVSARLHQHAATCDDLDVLGFEREPMRWLERASRVVTMGGYNSMIEVLSFGRPTLVVPRVRPRQEQWIRARRLEALDLVDVVHPAALSADAITAWLAAPVRAPRVQGRVAFDGLEHVRRRVQALLGTDSRQRDDASHLATHVAA